ncbi:MAG: MASE1 domain-containing protein [Gemmatimonadetes bacterium]|nr:MASE1 domain-containing protein [Gemmatimonadota bacterium]
MDNRLRQAGVTLALAAVYFLAARIGLVFHPVSGFATLIWPPAGIALAAILLLGRHVAPGIFLGAFAANWVSGAGVLAAIGIGLGNTGEALVGAVVLQRMPGFSITLERVSSVVVLIVWSAVASTLIAATAGVMSLHLAGHIGAARIFETWRAWWIGDMVGVMLFAPLVLAWANRRCAPLAVHWLETAALVASLAIACGVAFFNELLRIPQLTTPFHQADPLVAILLWAALRFGQRGVTTAVLCASTVAVISAAMGLGPFTTLAFNDALLPLQMFIAIVAATCLIISATIAERQIANLEAHESSRVAEQANSAKTQFLRVMSHELRTPLNAIAGYAEILESGVHGPLNEKQIASVKRIQQNEKDLLGIINEVLGFVEAEKSPVEAECHDMRVADAFDVAERMLAAAVERKRLVVERELADPRLGAYADPKMLEQILAALVSNAVKYTGEGGTITLGAERDDDKVCIWVRDTGIGIKKEEMTRVFEPFFQADSGTTRQYSGVGLGLTIARDLARRMHGEVTLTSKEGKGTSAMVVLPAASLKRVEVLAQHPAQEVAA